MEGATRTGEAVRVFVWHALDAAPPPRLMAALAARGIESVRVSSVYRALAELCGAGRGASPALVIVHPETMPEAAALWEAKARYAPGSRIWLYGPASAPQLRAVVEADVEGWGPGAIGVVAGVGRPEVVVKPYVPRPETRERAEAGPRSGASGQPRLKLAGEGGLKPEAEDGPGDRGNLLTPEELRMLLGEDEPGAGQQR